MNVLRRHGLTFVNAALCVLGVGLGVLVYFSFLERAWLTFPSLPMPVGLTLAHPGEAVPVYVQRFSRDRDTRGYQTTREIVCDKLPKPIPLATTLLPPPVEPGLTFRVSRGLVVPTEYLDDEQVSRPMPVDTTCFFAGLAEVNGMVRTNKVPWRTAPFKVVAP